MLLEEHDDEEILISLLLKKKRRQTKHIYIRRAEEGYANILIKHHLLGDQETFKQFFRINKTQFYFVLGLIGDALTKTPSRRVIYPITAQEKLSLTLR